MKKTPRYDRIMADLDAGLTYDELARKYKMAPRDAYVYDCVRLGRRPKGRPPRPIKSFEPLSADDIAELRRRNAAGETETRLRAEYGISHERLHRVLTIPNYAEKPQEHNGGKPKRVFAPEQLLDFHLRHEGGETLTQIAKSVNSCTGTIRERLQEAGYPTHTCEGPSSEVRARIAEDYINGATLCELREKYHYGMIALKSALISRLGEEQYDEHRRRHSTTGQKARQARQHAERARRLAEEARA